MDKQTYERIKQRLDEAKKRALAEDINLTSAVFEDIVNSIFEDEGVTEEEYKRADKKWLYRGEKGEGGDKGDKGDRGDSIIGPQGPKGDKGDSIKGDKGDRGDRGDTVVNKEDVTKVRQEVSKLRTNFDNIIRETHKKIRDIKVPQDYVSVSALEPKVKDIVGPELNRTLRSVQSQIFAANKRIDGTVNPGTPIRGDVIIANSTPAWSRLPVGAANSVLWSDGTDPSWSVAPRLANIADTGGTNRIALAASPASGSPHVILTGNVNTSGQLTVGEIGVSSAVELYVSGFPSTSIFTGYVIGASLAHTLSANVTDRQGFGFFNVIDLNGFNMGNFRGVYSNPVIVDTIGGSTLTTYAAYAAGIENQVAGVYAVGYDVESPSGSATGTTGAGIRIQDIGTGIFTTSVAIDIIAQTNSGGGIPYTIRALGTAPSIHQPALTLGANAAPTTNTILDLPVSTTSTAATINVRDILTIDIATPTTSSAAYDGMLVQITRATGTGALSGAITPLRVSFARTINSAITNLRMAWINPATSITGAGAITNIYGLAIDSLAYGTNRYGLQITRPATGTPTIGYGLHITGAGAGTTNIALYQDNATGQNRLFANTSIGVNAAPTAKLHLGAGTTVASTAPLKLTTGTNNTTAELGAIEFTDPDIFFSLTDTTVKRKAFVLDDGARLTSGRIPAASTNGRLIDGPVPAADGTYTPVNSITISKGLITAIS